MTNRPHFAHVQGNPVSMCEREREKTEKERERENKKREREREKERERERERESERERERERERASRGVQVVCACALVCVIGHKMGAHARLGLPDKLFLPRQGDFLALISNRPSLLSRVCVSTYDAT